MIGNKGMMPVDLHDSVSALLILISAGIDRNPDEGIGQEFFNDNL
jgi:hypothetical protein